MPIPPEAASSVFYCRVECEIDAPIDVVWDILTDLPRNPSVPRMTVVSASKQPLSTSEQKLTASSVGSFLDMDVRAPTKVKAFEEILTVDEAEHRLNWSTRDFPTWALRTERRQSLEKITATGDNNAAEKTKYEALALFNGPMAHVLRMLMRAKLEAAFQATATALKERAEKRPDAGAGI